MRWTLSTNESLLSLCGDGLCCGDDGMALSNVGWFGMRGRMALPLTHTCTSPVHPPSCSLQSVACSKRP